MEALQISDDGGGWQKRRILSYEGESLEDEDKVERLGSGLEALVWPPKLLWGLRKGVKKTTRIEEGETYAVVKRKHHRQPGL